MSLKRFLVPVTMGAVTLAVVLWLRENPIPHNVVMSIGATLDKWFPVIFFPAFVTAIAFLFLTDKEFLLYTISKILPPFFGVDIRKHISDTRRRELKRKAEAEEIRQPPDRIKGHIGPKRVPDEGPKIDAEVIIEDVPEDSILRLGSELRRVRKQGTVSLLVGIFVAAAGVGLVLTADWNRKSPFPTNTAGAKSIVTSTNALYPVAADQPPATENSEMRIEYELLRLLPRISLLIVIEFLAYFFLKNYRLTFDEARFYHSELNTLEIRRTALKVAREEKATAPKALEKILTSMGERSPAPVPTEIRNDNNVLLEGAVKLLEAAKK